MRTSTTAHTPEPGVDQQPGHGGPATHERPPERNLEADAELFAKALLQQPHSKPDEDSQSSDGQQEREKEPLPPGPAMSLGDGILRGMLSAPVSPQPKTLEAERDHALSDLVKQVADRLLVSAEGSGPDTEVRILLKNDILPQTEVRITRDHGTLQIQFVTTSDDSAHWLTAQQAGMQELLGQRLARESVRVTVQRGAEAEMGSDGRGRDPQQDARDGSGNSHEGIR